MAISGHGTKEARPRLGAAGRVPRTTSEDGHAVDVRRLGDGLVEGGAAGPAVTTAAGGDAQRLGAVVHRAAGVAGLGAHGGLDQALHRATALVVDRDVQRGDHTAVGAGGRPGALDVLTDERVRRRIAAGVAQRGVVVADQRVVVAREAVTDGRADQRGVAGVGVPGLGDLAAVTGGQEVVRAGLDDVEAERAAVLAAVDGVAG